MTEVKAPPPSRPRKPRRTLLPTGDAVTIWIVVIGSIALIALLARSGVDVAVLLLVAAALFVLQRTVGDWLLDALGPAVSKVVFVGGLVVAGLVALSFGSVRDAIWRGLGTADGVGLHSILLERLGDRRSRGVPSSTGAAAADARPQAVAGPAAPESRAPAAPAAGTRIVLRLAGQPGVRFMAEVLSSDGTVDEGSVEFSIDGRLVATARVSDGRAQATVGAVARGPHRAQARYLGTGRFAESVADVAFNR